MAKRKGVELTDSARRKAEKAGILKKAGKGKVRKEGETIIRRETSGQRARAAADRALGITRR